MKRFFIFLFLLPLLLPAVLKHSEAYYTQLRENMVQEQIIDKHITDPRIINAFKRVKRHLFVDRSLWEQAYGGEPLPIAEDENLTAPYIQALMTSIIATSNQKRVLEIGTGSGYQAAILAELVKEVFTIEIKKKLAEESRKLLLSLGYKNIRFKLGNGYEGWREYAPFDGIIVTCAPDDIPSQLIEQLAKGGRMVIPITYSNKVQELLLVDKDLKGKLKKSNLISVQFKNMIRGEYDN